MKPSTRKVIRWLVYLVGGPLLLLVLFLIEEHLRGGIQLEHYVSRMRARGEKFTIVELMPPPAPPADNGAGLMIGAGFPQNRIVPLQIPGSMRYAAAGAAIPAVSIRAWSVRGQNEIRLATNFLRAAENSAYSRSSNETNSPSQPGRGSRAPSKTWRIVTAHEVAEEIEANSNTLAQVRAALSYPQFDHVLPYSQAFTMMLPHLAREKAASQWLRAASFSALQQTNTGEALKNLAALAAFSHMTTNEALMISQLVRIAILQISVGATWEALQAEGWNDSQLKELQGAFAPSDFVRSMIGALEMERAFGATMIERAAKDPAALKGLFDMDMDMQWSRISLPESVEETIEPFSQLFKNMAPAFNRFIYYPVWAFAWKDQDKLHLLQHWQTSIESGRAQISRPDWVANNPDPDQKMPPGTEVNEEQRRGSAYDRVRYLFSSRLETLGTKTMTKAVTAEAAQQLAVAAIAIRRFEMANGRVPGSLDELVPNYLPAVPFDPFDGRPLRYKRKEVNSFALYSVGTDGKDDGGDTSLGKQSSRPSFLNGVDLIWPRRATPEEIQNFIETETRRSPWR